ncbi:TipAS antibiotic-recognition domain-containing protein [Pararhizobium sp. IMCC21322]|uniref:TipAS antibiotic-recognition domain-containing protein n=1 Tax=Pararhizobium sp. IMCC21322 TaxID=3067903 RepID=UPI0027428BD5|nr:TipAS antibiotic-recognition domain-containing protein [Pararhizobium sp. IMCC21322]
MNEFIQYVIQLFQRYGADLAAQIATSRAAIGVMPGGMENVVPDLKSVETDLVSAYQSGTNTAAECLHTLFEKHRAWIARMRGKMCDADGYEGLADAYRSHPDIITRI